MIVTESSNEGLEIDSPYRSMTKKDMADVIVKLEVQQSTLKDKQLRLKQRGEELERLAGSTGQ